MDVVDLCSDEEMEVDDAEGGGAAEQPEARLPLGRHNRQAAAAPGMLQHRAAGDGKAGAPAGQQQQPAEPTQSGLIVRTHSGSWRPAVAAPCKVGAVCSMHASFAPAWPPLLALNLSTAIMLQGPGVYLFTTKPFGQDRKQPEPAEYRLPNGNNNNKSCSNTLRRITFIYSHSNNPFFTSKEQQAAAQVMVRLCVVHLACQVCTAAAWLALSRLWARQPAAAHVMTLHAAAVPNKTRCLPAFALRRSGPSWRACGAHHAGGPTAAQCTSRCPWHARCARQSAAPHPSSTRPATLWCSRWAVRAPSGGARPSG